MNKLGLTLILVLSMVYVFARVIISSSSISITPEEGLLSFKKSEMKVVWEKLKTQVNDMQRHIPLLRTPVVRQPQKQMSVSINTPKADDERKWFLPLLRTPIPNKMETNTQEHEAKIEQVGRHIPVLRTPMEPKNVVEEEEQRHIPLLRTPYRQYNFGIGKTGQVIVMTLVVTAILLDVVSIEEGYKASVVSDMLMKEA
ncbi:hypothetical protein Pcinc_042022 [Petrolisthes cinctipes]|uniref:Uncharacterized protein n=1 Tax=Petrolisthes cinctipes TaxID=88211 RepID=A0AAE1EGG1_PETCI|nr:hypothetical protein Pcinc_042022 [Petrolisthes cinctipes]